MNKIFQIVIWVLALSIIGSTMFYTRHLTQKIQDRDLEVLNLYAKIYETYINSFVLGDNNSENSTVDNTDYLMLLIEEITPTIDSPFIYTDENDVPIPPYESWSLNIDLSNIPKDKQEKYMQDYVIKMGKVYPPILVRDGFGGNSKVLQKIYYYHSDLVDQLRWIPITVIFVIFGLIALIFLAFSYFKKNEESRVWVGMAKEAAHQLGTPLSSLMAWIEILKFSKDDPEQIEMTYTEMSKDVDRLNTIAKRFSKIGSIPDKEFTNISVQLENICRYFEVRLPHLGKRIDIVKEIDEKIFTEINIELFAWVIENLLKNASEAIDDLSGEVLVKLSIHNNKKIIIMVKDTGKGMSKKNKRRVFNAGFTTKRRGWGLGLTLTKRIIEEYHNGKIYIKETHIGKGTTFMIELPTVENQD